MKEEERSIDNILQQVWGGVVICIGVAAISLVLLLVGILAFSIHWSLGILYLILILFLWKAIMIGMVLFVGSIIYMIYAPLEIMVVLIQRKYYPSEGK